MKKKYYLVSIFESHYCKIVFVLSFIGTYFLIPTKAFHGYFIILSFLLMLTTSIVVTCLIRNIKERALAAKNAGSSILNIILTIIGLTAIQTCGIGAPICGATIGTGIISLVLPSASTGFFDTYSVQILVVTITLQITSLYFMNCFKKIGNHLIKPCNNSNTKN